MKNYVTESELHRLKILAKQVLKDTYIVEIGVLNGDTSIALLGIIPETVKYIGIDPLIPDSMKPELQGDIHKLCKLERLYKNFTFIKSYSHLVDRDYAVPPKIGMLFIDGDHRYDSVKLDYEIWIDKVVLGGSISFHDAAPKEGFAGWPGPTKLVDELITGEHSQSNLVTYESKVDTLVTFRKTRNI